MHAERLSTADEILRRWAAMPIEYKYDGERAQIHFGEGDAFPHLFSRALRTSITTIPTYPIIVNARRQFQVLHH
jgi:ATP-dependent DNA ligase